VAKVLSACSFDYGAQVPPELIPSRVEVQPAVSKAPLPQETGGSPEVASTEGPGPAEATPAPAPAPPAPVAEQAAETEVRGCRRQRFRS
jgi:hypothetical protein